MGKAKLVIKYVDAAKILNVHPCTVKRWLLQGQLAEGINRKTKKLGVTFESVETLKKEREKKKRKRLLKRKQQML